MTDTTNANSEPGQPAGLGCNEGLGPLPERWYVVDRNGLATVCAGEADARTQELQSRALYHRHAPYRAVRLVDAVTADALRAALTELRDRIKAHPAYAELTEAEELETGGDTAELSYLARVADDALRA
jgi:hypothetical protein